MPKWLWITLFIVLTIIALANLGPMIALAISLFIGYILFKQFFKTESPGVRIAIVIGVIFLTATALSNIFALVGLLAGYGLYVLIKNRDDVYDEETKEEEDPFSNFEKEWSKFQKYY